MTSYSRWRLFDTAPPLFSMGLRNPRDAVAFCFAAIRYSATTILNGFTQHKICGCFLLQQFVKKGCSKSHWMLEIATRFDVAYKISRPLSRQTLITALLVLASDCIPRKKSSTSMAPFSIISSQLCISAFLQQHPTVKREVSFRWTQINCIIHLIFKYDWY